MQFSIQDRMVISTLFPKYSNMLTQLIVKGIISKVRITEQELKEIGLKRSPDKKGFIWNKEIKKDVNVELTDVELKFLQAQVNEFDKEKQISRELVDLCVKIRETRIGDV